MLLLDNIVFELQRAGGVSLVWRAILDACIQDAEFEFNVLDNEMGKSNLFYPTELAQKHRIPDNFFLKLRRYLPVFYQGETTAFHSSYFRTHHNRRVKNIVTVHDFVYEKFDSGLSKHVHLWQKQKALQHADVIICVSHNTKEDLLQYHPNLANRDIRVIHNGVSSHFFAADVSESELGNAPYLLYVGGRFAHKNFSAALQLLNSPIAKQINLQLKVAGGGAFSEHEAKIISAMKLTTRVTHVGHVSDQHLARLYGDAFAFIYPSLYEGFGIPPLEAMAANCPAICANVSSIPEVVGSAGLLFNPSDITSAERHIDNLIDRDFRKNVIENGRKHAQTFSWEKTGQSTLALYKEMV